MAKSRGTSDIGQLTNGPGKLTKALSIDGAFTGEDLVKSKRLYVLGGERPADIVASSRVGISKGQEQQWRFFVEGNPFVPKRNT